MAITVNKPDGTSVQIFNGPMTARAAFQQAGGSPTLAGLTYRVNGGFANASTTVRDGQTLTVSQASQTGGHTVKVTSLGRQAAELPNVASSATVEECCAQAGASLSSGAQIYVGGRPVQASDTVGSFGQQSVEIIVTAAVKGGC